MNKSEWPRTNSLLAVSLLRMWLYRLGRPVCSVVLLTKMYRHSQVWLRLELEKLAFLLCYCLGTGMWKLLGGCILRFHGKIRYLIMWWLSCRVSENAPFECLMNLFWRWLTCLCNSTIFCFSSLCAGNAIFFSFPNASGRERILADHLEIKWLSFIIMVLPHLFQPIGAYKCLLMKVDLQILKS